MDISCLKEEWDPIVKAKALIAYNKQFKLEHPHYFYPSGTLIFCGSQGSGKTLSAVNYVYKLWKKYPYMIVCTNVSLADFPFNAGYRKTKDGNYVIYSLESGEIITSESILSGEYTNVCIEYDGLDCLKFIGNGEYGVVYFIDELHLELNSLESKNVDVDVMVEISQQRKQRKHIIGTSQVYMRLAKPLREQIKNVVLCTSYFRYLQYNRLIDGEKSVEKDGKLEADVKRRILFMHSPDFYRRYDTYAKMRRYNKLWNGHKRDSNFVYAQVHKERS